MAYTPTLWAKGDKVTSEKLNKIEQGIVDKVDKEIGKTLSTNDFTDAYKTKLDGIEANADKTTIDATLTNSGAAADAKVTGDAIQNIETDLDGKVATIESNLDEKVENLKSLVGTPLKATTASAMTDTSKIYVYTGNESGYTNGDWYYHDGSAWVDGGTYNSVAVEVDKTLTVDGMPADSKTTGDEIGALKSGFNELPSIKDSDAEDVDLDVSDVNGNVIVRFKGGHIKTKNFDSADLDGQAGVKTTTVQNVDLDVSDSHGNVVLRIADGHIKTKRFDSADYDDKTVYVTVKKDGTGDFTTLRDAIESITDADAETKPYTILIHDGIYNLTDEYSQNEIEAVDTEHYANGFVGWMLTDGISLVGVGTRDNIILSCNLDTSIYDQSTRMCISTLNTQGTMGLENLTVIAENIRYCVHDDFSYQKNGQYYRWAKNCNFIGVLLGHNPPTTWGGGMSGAGENALFENCDFGTDYGHHFDASRSVTLTFRNCRGRKLRVAERNKTAIHYINVENSDFEMISIMRPADVTGYQRIKINANGCDKSYVLSNDNSAILTGAIVKAPLTGLPVGTMVARTSNRSNQYVTTSDRDIADGVIVANDNYCSYIQRTGYINTRVLGMSGFAIGDYVTLDASNVLVLGGTEETAVGQITFISNDSDTTDNGIGFVRMFVGGE